jgi:hypothetical protein
MACSLYVLVFWISASVSHEIKSQGQFIVGFRSNPTWWHEYWRKRMSEGQNRLYHVASLLGRVMQGWSYAPGNQVPGPV